MVVFVAHRMLDRTVGLQECNRAYFKMDNKYQPVNKFNSMKKRSES